VTHEQGKRLAEEMKAVFLETSAKDNQNVENIFTRVVAQMESLDQGGGDGEEKKCIVM
jgi:putative heme iron utilization protein